MSFDVTSSMIPEASKRSAETKETKNPNLENYKKIKPKEGTTVKSADDFWKQEFSKEAEASKNNEGNIETNEAGERVYHDDNGEVYRVGDNLESNKTFELNGYKYKTDDKGRTISAEGKLKIVPKHERKMDSMDAVGKGDQKETDHRGHSIGHQFNGTDGIENVTAMDGNLNTGAYKAMETRLADAVKDGADVKLKVEPKYEGDSNRPTEYKATYTIDGEKEVIVFRNDGLEVK